MAKAITLVTSWLVNVAWASNSVHHGLEHQIPWNALIPQFLNFTAVIFLVIVFGRKKISVFFIEREARYSELVTRAEAARFKAEETKQKMSERLSKLDQSATESVEKARSEAAELKSKIIIEAQELAERIELETRRSAQFELERAKNELRSEMAREALHLAQGILSQELDTGKQKRLQHEFVEKIQVVS